MKIQIFSEMTASNKLLHVKFIYLFIYYVLRFYAHTCTCCRAIFSCRLRFLLGEVNITCANSEKYSQDGVWKRK